MKVSKRGLQVIKSFEGFASNIYVCPAGFKTIGFGHKLRNHENLTNISIIQAEALLRRDLLLTENYLNNQFIGILNQNMFDALNSFIFNIGLGSFVKSTMHKLIAKKDLSSAAKEFKRWVYCKGKILKGLVRRRSIEQALFTA